MCTHIIMSCSCVSYIIYMLGITFHFLFGGTLMILPSLQRHKIKWSAFIFCRFAGKNKQQVRCHGEAAVSKWNVRQLPVCLKLIESRRLSGWHLNFSWLCHVQTSASAIFFFGAANWLTIFKYLAKMSIFRFMLGALAIDLWNFCVLTIV